MFNIIWYFLQSSEVAGRLLTGCTKVSCVKCCVHHQSNPLHYGHVIGEAQDLLPHSLDCFRAGVLQKNSLQNVFAISECAQCAQVWLGLVGWLVVGQPRLPAPLYSPLSHCQPVTATTAPGCLGYRANHLPLVINTVQ